MTSIKKLNAIAGTSYTRWKQVAKALTPKEDTVKELEDFPPPTEQSEFPPRITNERVIFQMRGAGYQFEDGYPVRSPGKGGDFQTGDVTWKFDDNGDLLVAWEPTTNEEHRVVQFGAIVDQPLVRAGDGSLDPSMFKTHHGWINYMTEYREKKLEAVRNAPAHVAAKQVAWFEAGVVVYQTTIGALLDQSIGAG